MALIEHLELTEYDLGGYSLGARTTVRMLAGFGAAPRRVIVSGMGLSGLLDTGKRAGHFRNILTHLGSFERGSLEWLAEAFLKTTKGDPVARSEEHTSELQSLMRISYAVFRLQKKK